MTNENLEEIEVVESTGGFEKTLYEGYRVPIGKIEVLYVQDVFPDGQTYTPDSDKKKWVLKITTQPLKMLQKDESGNVVASEHDVEFPNEDGTVDKLQITTDLNFQNKKDENGQLVTKEYEENGQKEMRPVPVISKAPKAKLWAFCRKMGVTDYKELTGKIVTLTIQPSKKDGDDRVFINVVI